MILNSTNLTKNIRRLVLTSLIILLITGCATQKTWKYSIEQESLSPDCYWKVSSSSTIFGSTS